MKQLDEYVKKNGVEYSDSLPNNDMLTLAEKELGLVFPKELKDYLLDYGYLICGSIELYGMTARQGLKSDLVTQTKYLHKYYEKTKDLIALENQGEGDYYLVNAQGEIVEFDSETEELIEQGIKFEQYLIKRFEENSF